MACVCLQRTTISLASRWRGRALKTSFLENPVVQNVNPLQLGAGSESNNSQLMFSNARQRIPFCRARSWEYGNSKNSSGVQLQCRSHSSSSTQEPQHSEWFTAGCDIHGAPSLPPLHLISPIVLYTRAVFLVFALRDRLRHYRLKFQTIGQGSQWEKGFDGRLLKQGGLGMALLSTSIIAKDRISPILLSLRANPTFMSGLVAWAIAQVMKVFTTYFVERKWEWKMLLGSGGMPSSHSALCVGLTTSVALCHGVSDCLFPVCLGFSLIVMYDAAGVRRHAGRQAEVLNMIVEDLFQGHPVSEKKLKELLGHTPLQVGAGALLGMICGYLCSQANSIY